MDARFAKIIETNASASEALGAKLESKFSEIRTSVDASLEKVRAGNEARLEEMRATVQEKLDRTLSERLTASFRTVDEKLGLVQTGLGEMRTMAESVRDLKGILANVRPRHLRRDAARRHPRRCTRRRPMHRSRSAGWSWSPW